MRKRFRNGAIAAAAAAALAVPALPATPALAQTYDCRILPNGLVGTVQEVVDCVYYILITAIDDPDLPPHN